MSGGTTAALVGATGGAGTTRTAVELAAVLARDGQEVAVLDAAFATQGLAAYLDGRIDPDLTRLLTDDADLDAGLVDLGVTARGRVACVPVRAPFERLARAKTAAAARSFENLIATVSARFDRVLVDTPPVASNQAIAAASGTERTVVVAPASTRGTDAIQRTRDRLADLDVETDAVLSTRGDLRVADASIPDSPIAGPAEAPVCLDDDAFAAAVAEAAAAVFDRPVDLSLEEPDLLDRFR